MNLPLVFLILGISILPVALAGLAVSPEEKPIKFLVLERSDIPDLDQFSDATTEIYQSDDEAVTGAELPEKLEVVTEADDVEVFSEKNVEDGLKEAIQLIWDPLTHFRENNFTIMPDWEGEFKNVPQNLKPMDGPVPMIRGHPFAEIKGVPCQCGKPTGRIVGGDPAKINDIPWTVALVRNGFFGLFPSKKPYCGGTLVNSLYVLTASHCVDGMLASGIKVWINDEDYLITEGSKRQEYFVDEIIMHDQYDRRTVNNDIALLKLKTPVPIGSPNTTIVPACLPANNDADFSGINATVSGWGLLSDGGSQSNVLRKVVVPVMTNEVCNSDQTRYKGRVSENMLCAGYMEGGRDSCQGDSGGPLIIDNSGRFTLIGVVSWGFGCAAPKSPGVYTRVGRYSPWIVANSKDAEWCGIP